MLLDQYICSASRCSLVTYDTKNKKSKFMKIFFRNEKHLLVLLTDVNDLCNSFIYLGIVTGPLNDQQAYVSGLKT